MNFPSLMPAHTPALARSPDSKHCLVAEYLMAHVSNREATSEPLGKSVYRI